MNQPTIAHLYLSGVLTDEEAAVLGLLTIGFDRDVANGIIEHIKNPPPAAVAPVAAPQPPAQPVVRRPRWTRSADAALIRLYEAETPIAVIAQQMGRSRSAVHARISRLGLPTYRKQQQQS